MVLLIMIVMTIGDSFSNLAGIVYIYPFSIVISSGLFVVWVIYNRLILTEIRCPSLAASKTTSYWGSSS